MTQNRVATSDAEQPSALDLLIGAESDVGPSRQLNEDYVDYFMPVDDQQLQEKGALFVVADGMGGHQAGEVASRSAVEQVLYEYYACTAKSSGESLVRAVKSANHLIYEQAVADPTKSGMGTTLVAAAVLDRQVHIANVGDSRAYLINSTGISQITRDHSWVEEQVQAGLLSREQAQQHPQRNLITRALGTKPSVEVDLYQGEMHPGDVLLLCTDGLSGALSMQQIASVAYKRSPSQAACELVTKAGEQKGDDNASVLVVKAQDPALKPPQPLGDSEDQNETEISVSPPLTWGQEALATLRRLAARVFLPQSIPSRMLPVWVGAILLVGICLVAAGLVLGRGVVGKASAAPELAPISHEHWDQDSPESWASILGYRDVVHMAQVCGDLDASNSSGNVQLWPAERGVLIAGIAKDWACRGLTCTFQLQMADKNYQVQCDRSALLTQGRNLNRRRLRVFGTQAGEGQALVADWVQIKSRWWAWWRPLWNTIDTPNKDAASVWVYGVAGSLPYSPVDLKDDQTLNEGDRILARGTWQEDGPRGTIELISTVLYRWDRGHYPHQSGSLGPAPRPTVTLVPQP